MKLAQHEKTSQSMVLKIPKATRISNQHSPDTLAHTLAHTLLTQQHKKHSSLLALLALNTHMSITTVKPLGLPGPGSARSCPQGPAIAQQQKHEDGQAASSHEKTAQHNFMGDTYHRFHSQ